MKRVSALASLGRCAVYNGIANGAFMVPLKQANKEVVGLEYLFSFGMGSAMATTVLVLTSWMFKPVDFQIQVAPRLTAPPLAALNACEIG